MQIVSSNIRTANYDRKSWTLTLTFINRPRWTYTYFKVPPRIWVEFVKAGSKGTYFTDIIRDRFQYSRTIS